MKTLLRKAKSKNPEFGVAYYLKPIILQNDNNGFKEIKMELCTKYIPYELKDLFKETFGDGILNITEETINIFLEENN